MLVSAPAGFGKTTLLSSWCHALAEEGAAVAWVGLDEGDDDPARFLAYLIAAVIKALGIPEGPAGPAPVAESTLTRLINTIVAARRPCLLALDDYHVISSPAIHSAVAFLLDHLPAGAYLAIGSRSDPPLPLARLQVRGQLVELRAADLRFTADEILSFLTAAGAADLPLDELAAVIELIEGWPAGAQLVALALRSGTAPFRDAGGRLDLGSAEGGHRLFAYLADEVFERQPPHIRRFLLHTAILDRLCAQLCAALGADEAPGDAREAAALLEALDHAGLFVVPLDAQRRWYRYHHLFRSFLLARLANEAPGLATALHRRAGDWCLRNGLPASALEHAFASGDLERATGLIERLALTLIERGEYATLRHWLRHVPAAARAAHPALDLWEAWAALLLGEVERVAPALERATRSSERAGDRAQLGAAAHLARLSGEAGPTIDAARQALADLPPAEVTTWAGSILALGAGQLLAGDLAAAEITLAEALAHCAAHNALGALAAHTALGDLAFRRGRLAEAEAHYRQVQEDAGDRPHWERWVATARLGAVACARGRLDDARELLHTALEAAERAGVAVYMVPAQLEYARVLLARGDGDSAAQAVERARQSALRLGSGPYLSQATELAAQLTQPGAGRGHNDDSALRLTLRRPDALVEPLSEREVEVLQLVASGASNQDIAERLVISVGTVKSHINHILGKIEARNRTEAVARARALGLLA